MKGHDSKDQTVGTGELGTRAMEQDRWDRKAGTDRWDRTGKQARRTWQTDRTGRTGEPEETVRIVQPGMATEDRMTRT
jgi:hypothetical protein